MTLLQLETGADGIATLTIDMPAQPINILDAALIAALDTAVQRIAEDHAIKGVIITSGNDRGFIAGADLKELVTACDRGETAAQGAARSVELSGIYRRLETCGKPVVAAINGLALGGGFELCLASHYRVIVDDAKAVVGLPEVNVGLLPAAGGTQRLPRLIGIPAALPLLLQGRPVPPREALKLGLVNAVVDRSVLLDHAREWLATTAVAAQPWDAKHFAVPGGAGPLAPHAHQSFTVGTAQARAEGGAHYPAPLAILASVYEGTQVSIDVGLRIESKYFGRLLSAPVARNLMRTLFINKNAAVKRGSRSGVPRKPFGKIGVIGAGMMGAGIAHVSAQAGITVVLLDSTPELAEKGKSHIAAWQAKELTRGRTTAEKIDALLARVVPTADYTDLADCELVIEAVFEHRDIKAEVTRRVEAVLPASAIVGSNTSTLPIGGLAQASVRPAQFIGIHFFSPVEKMPLVEIIVGEKTGSDTVDRALALVAQLRKTPIVVHDHPGFFTSRVFSTFVQEGMAMLAEGIAPALIENAARQAGFPVGPLAASDEVSLSLQQSILKQHDIDRVPEHYRIVVGRPVIDRMVDELGRAGRKAGGGFYDYPAEAPKQLWAELGRHFPIAAVQPTADAIGIRLLTIMALESARCIEAGVVTQAMDADLGSILGIGYPSWTGGTLSYIDTVGIAAFVTTCQHLQALHGPRFAPSPWLLARAGAGRGFYTADAAA